MTELGLGNVIEVSLSATPQGLTSYKTNNIALFSNEATTAVTPYITARAADEVERAYGSNSLTTKMARAIFTPSLNLRNGEGSLFVFHYDGVDAVAGSQTTGAITATKINAFKQVADGALKITIDGQVTEITDLNFSAITDVDDVVAVIKAQQLDCDIAVVDTNKIRFTSRTFGTDSAIAFSAATEGTDISGTNYLDSASMTEVEGVAASGTTLADAVAAAEQQAFFGGIVTTQVCENETVLANASAIQEGDHIYYECITSLNNIEVLGGAMKSAGNGKTRLLAYASGSTEGAKKAIATYATVASSVNYTGTDTCITMNLKTLTGIVPDAALNQTYVDIANANGVDVYGSLEGLGCVFSFDNNGYTDDLTNQLWLKKALEVAGFNYLRQTNTKVPQTEAGMVGLKGAYQTCLEQGVRNGFIGVGIGWSSEAPIPFGNPVDFRRNIEETGYYIYSLPVAQQAQSEREARKAPLVQIAVKAAGAIHHSDVIVTIQR